MASAVVAAFAAVASMAALTQAIPSNPLYFTEQLVDHFSATTSSKYSQVGVNYFVLGSSHRGCNAIHNLLSSALLHE